MGWRCAQELVHSAQRGWLAGWAKWVWVLPPSSRKGVRGGRGLCAWGQWRLGRAVHTPSPRSIDWSKVQARDGLNVESRLLPHRVEQAFCGDLQTSPWSPGGCSPRWAGPQGNSVLVGGVSRKEQRAEARCQRSQGLHCFQGKKPDSSESPLSARKIKSEIPPFCRTCPPLLVPPQIGHIQESL